MDIGIIDKMGKDQLLAWIGDNKLSLELIFRASTDGFSAADFHRKCDNKDATVMVVQGSNNWVYGGYTKQNWDTSGTYKPDPQSFLFVLKKGNAVGMEKFVQQSNVIGICSTANMGPYFVYNGATNHEFGVFTAAGENKLSYALERNGYFYPDGARATRFFGGSNGGNVQIVEAEVYQVREPKLAMPKQKLLETGPWRKVLDKWSEEVRDGIKEEIAQYSPPEELCIQTVNILMVGPVGAGKSSFFNTVNSVYRGHVTAQAATGTASSGLTTKFRRYEIRNRTAGGSLKIRLCDTLGFAEDQGLDIPDIPYLLDGHIPDRFQFNTLAPITPQSHGFMEQPDFGDKIHIVAFILSAEDIDKIPDKVTDKLKATRTQARARGIPMVVLMTHTDLVLEEPGKLDTMFSSQTIYTALEEAAGKLGVPKGHVLPVVNYENEVELDTHMDILALLALRQILRFADNYFDDQIDVLGAAHYTPSKKKSNKSKASKKDKIDEPN